MQNDLGPCRDRRTLGPVRQFAAWYRGLQQAKLPEPGAMMLATTTQTGASGPHGPAQKSTSIKHGFVFCTSYESAGAASWRKIRERLPWCSFGQPAPSPNRIRGTVVHVTTEGRTHAAGFVPGHCRGPASQQSSLLRDRAVLGARVAGCDTAVRRGVMVLRR